MTTKRSLLASLSALILATASFPAASFAGGDDVAPVERYDREDRYVEREYVPECRPQPRTVYIIIKERPVRRVVYAAPAGGYYRFEGSRRVIVREPCYTSLPPRYVTYGYRGRFAGPHCY